MKNILINIVKSIKVINIEMFQNKCSRAKGRLTIVEHFNDLNFLPFSYNVSLIIILQSNDPDKIFRRKWQRHFLFYCVN